MANRWTTTEEKKAKIKASLSETREKRKSQVCRVFKVKIQQNRLSKKQKEELKMIFVEAKWVRNYIIGLIKDGTKWSELPVIHSKTEIPVKTKKGVFENRQLRFISASQIQEVIDEVKANLKSIITNTKRKNIKHGELNFVSEVKSVGMKQYKMTYSFKGRTGMKIQGVSKKVHVNGLDQFINEEGLEFANAKVLNQADGYFVAITTYTPKENFKRITNGKSMGVDFGIKHNLTTSEGETIDCSIEEPESLKKASKRMNHCKKGSSNRMRNRKKLQKCYQKLENKRTNAANQAVAKFRNYDKIVIQDEQLKEWHKGLFGAVVQHSCMGRVKAKLKAMPNVVVLDKFIPTTKLCMNCGKVHEIKLSDRTFKCECGVKGDRDVHAAKTMLEIVEMLKLPPEQREVKRVEFLEAYSKKFGCEYGTMKHEDATFQGCH